MASGNLISCKAGFRSLIADTGCAVTYHSPGECKYLGSVESLIFNPS